MENTVRTIVKSGVRGGDKKMTILVDADPKAILAHVGLESLTEYYVEQLIAHKALGMFDQKKHAGKKELTVDWTGDKLPVYKSGTRAGEPSKEDLEWGQQAYQLTDDRLDKVLELWAQYEAHGFTAESIQEEEDPEYTLACLKRAHRLAHMKAADISTFFTN